MKILFLHNLAEPELGGGAETTLWTLMRGLRDAGHTCVLLATSDQAGLKRTEREGVTLWKAGIRNVYWPFQKKRPSAPLRMLWHALDSYNPLMQGFLREVVAREQPDGASLHALPGWSAAVWSTLAQLGVPVVQVLHGHEAICAKATMYRKARNCSAQCAVCHALRLPHRTLSTRVAAVIGVSRYILERHRSLGYFQGVRIQRVIHNARAPEALGLHAKSYLAPHSGVRFGYIGRLDPAKGIEALIDAFLAADLPEAELRIAGSGRQHNERRLHNKTKDTRIHFLGRIPTHDFYSQVDVVVIPSLLNDNLPGVVFEALAFGKPVIGSRRGGIPEMIRDGENGLLFEPEAPGQLRAALEALQDDVLRASLAERARPSSVPFVDVAKWVKTYEALYHEVATARPRPTH